MAKSGRRSTTGGTETATAKRDGLVAAAFQALREEGFARTSARGIASRAGCNSALVFYYFDSVNDLLVEALADSSRTQLAKYEEAFAGATRLDELVASVQGRLRDDMVSGHVKVLAELIGASSSDQQLRAAVLAQVAPWMELTERSLQRVLAASGLGGLVPVDQLAFVMVSLFLGMELLTDIAGDAETIDRLFESAHLVTGVLGALALPETPGATA